MKNKKIVIYLVSLVAVIILATVGYNLLSSYVDPNDGFSSFDSDNSEDNDDNSDNSSSSDDENNSDDNDSDDVYPDAADFTFYDYEGETQNLSDFYGKPIVINFWASWCDPCKDEMPDLDEVYLEYGEDVHFLFVNMTDGDRETEEIVKAFMETGEGAAYSFPIYFDHDYDGAITYGVSSIPTTYVIDKNAKIVAYAKSVISKDSLSAALDELLLEE